MELQEAKRILIDYARKKLTEIESVSFLEAHYYIEEKKNMEKLIEILKDGGIY